MSGGHASFECARLGPGAQPFPLSRRDFGHHHNAQLLPSPSSATLAERTVFQRSSELKNWAEVLSVSPGSERIGVRYALKSSPHLHNQLFACPEAQRFVRGNHWHTCVLPRRECLAVSIGIGGDWKFEDGLVSRGCEVHAFDPTAELRAKHEKHAGAPSTLGRMKFHFLGLGNGGRPSGCVTRATRMATWMAH